MIGYSYFSYVKGRRQRAVQFGPTEEGKEAGRKHPLIVRHAPRKVFCHVSYSEVPLGHS